MSTKRADIKVEIEVKQVICDKCDKIISQDLVHTDVAKCDPRHLYGYKGIPVHPHSCVTHPNPLDDNYEIHLCEECFRKMVDEWLAPPVPEAPTPPDHN